MSPIIYEPRVRNYRIRSTRENAVVTGGSTFNVKAESLRLG